MYSQQRVVCKCNNKKGQRDANPMALFFFMKYFLHDTNSFNDERITELYINYGYEGLGLFYTLLEKFAAQEKPIKTIVLKKQLNIGKRLEKCWYFMEQIEIIYTNNGETFNERILKFSERYQIKNKKNAERVLQWRENQAIKKNVTHNERVRNADKLKESKVKESKVIIIQDTQKKSMSNPDKLEVNSYFSELAFFDESERFFDYYTANGWRVGKNKMKDWKAAARNWCKNSKTFNNGKSNQSDIEKRIANHNDSIEWANEYDRKFRPHVLANSTGNNQDASGGIN
jgi:hypothetical protein